MSHAKGAQWDKDEGFRYWTCEPVKPVSCGETSTSGEDGAFRFFTSRLGEGISTKRDVCLRFLLSSEAGKCKRGMSWVHVVIWPWETHTWPVTYHGGTQTRRKAVRKLAKGKKDELDPCGNLTMGNTHMARYVPLRDAGTGQSCSEAGIGKEGWVVSMWLFDRGKHTHFPLRTTKGRRHVRKLMMLRDVCRINLCTRDDGVNGTVIFTYEVLLHRFRSIQLGEFYKVTDVTYQGGY